jgi:hypothetical protein
MPTGIYKRKSSKPSDWFWSKVENSSGADCWQWLGYINSDGYGAFRTKRNGKRTMKRAHRIAYELRCGPVPLGLCVLHHCNNPGCVNPAHLFLGTQADNIADMAAKGRNAKGEKNGRHKLTWDEIDWIHVYANQLGWSNTLLAECHGVWRSTISYVLSEKTWRYCQ